MNKNEKIKTEFMTNFKKTSFNKVFDRAPMPMVLVQGEEWKMIAMNSAMEEMIGSSNLQSFMALLEDNKKELMSKQYALMQNAGAFGPLEVDLVKSNGDMIPVKVSGNLIEDNHQAIACCYFEDTSSQKKLKEKLNYHVTHDPLTGLANRKLFYERLSLSLEFSKREGDYTAVIVIDVKDFKRINKENGQVIGDKVLMVLAERLESLIKRNTDTVARTSGNEFMVVLSMLYSVDDAKVIAEQLVDLLEKPIAIVEHAVKVEVGIGVGVYPSHGESVDDLIDIATQAAESAKTNPIHHAILAVKE